MTCANTKTLSIALGYLLSQLVSVSATAGATEVTKIDISEPAAQRLFMWKVKGKPGKEATAYLVGSIHMLPPDFLPLPADMEAAFNKAQTLVVEANIDDHPEAARKLMLERAAYPEGDNLSKHVSKETSDELTKYLKKSGLSVERFFSMKPWLIGSTITLLELQNQGFNAESGIDKHFLAEASLSKKPIVPLETAEFEVNILSQFDDDQQEKFLSASLLDAEHSQEDARTMLHAWKTGDDREMLSIITRDEREHPELKPIMEKVIYDRNITMAAKIAEMLEKPGTYFVVLGAGHIIGPTGLVTRLKDKHYQVEQVLGR